MPRKRFASRAAAVAAFQLPYELLAPELLNLLARDAALSPAACAYVIDTKGRAEELRVLHGSEGTTEGLRALLAAGIWPGPPSFPSLARIIEDGLEQRAFAGPLWGEGCPEEGPWTPLWRERGIRLVYMLTAIAPSGLAAVGLFNCQRKVPERSVAMGEGLSPIVADVLDRAPAPGSSPVVVVREAQLGFGHDGELTALGVDCAEMLRDAGGGGAGALARMRLGAQAAAKTLLQQIASRPEPAVVGGAQDEETLRRELFRLKDAGPRPVARSQLADSRFGKFELTLTAAAEPGGGMLALGTVRQFAPRAVALLRALIACGAPAREIELTRLLDEGVSLINAAAQMGLAQSSAETLFDRLCGRFAAAGREGLLGAMVEAGRARKG